MTQVVITEQSRVTFALVRGVSEGVAQGVKTIWGGLRGHALPGEPIHLSNEFLLEYAARNPPPQRWFDEDENLF